LKPAKDASEGEEVPAIEETSDAKESEAKGEEDTEETKKRSVSIRKIIKKR